MKVAINLFILAIFSALFSDFAVCQVLTFSEDIATILYENCTKCHRTGGIGPFKIEGYQDAVNNGIAIKSAVSSGYMPPWPPDTSYSRFSHERTLTKLQINSIVNWVDAGMPQGNIANEPEVPVFSTNSELSTVPSAIYKMPVYNITSNQDDYRAFVIPNLSNTTLAVGEVEFYPGNRKIVHHILVYYDTSGICQQLDNADPLPGYKAFGGIGNQNAKQIAGWVPGSPPLKLPAQFGIPAYKNGKYVMQVHYAPGSAGKLDSTSFAIVYKPITNGMREVFQYPILNHFIGLENGPLVIQAERKKKFFESFTLPIPISILGVTPHMHLIGRDKVVYATKPNRTDTTKLIRIKDWNFNWQGQYMYKNLLVLPLGTKIRSESLYDNTLGNPYNPSNPTQLVTAGESTLNEMMMTYFMFVNYQPGDENISLENSVITKSGSHFPKSDLRWKIYPNPAENEIYLVKPDIESRILHTKYYAVDMNGKRIVLHPKRTDNPFLSESYRFDVSELKSGLYYLIGQTEGATKRIGFVKK